MCVLCERGVREKLRVFFMATSHDVINPPPHPAADAHANKQAQCMNNEVQWLCWSKYYMRKFKGVTTHRKLLTGMTYHICQLL